MSKVEYPRIVFALTRNFHVQKVTLVRPQSVTYDWGGYTKGGKFYRRGEIFETKPAAIKAGRAQIRRRQKGLEAGIALLAKHAAALDKVEGRAAAHAAHDQKGGGNAGD